MIIHVGYVHELVRYPVKSMAGVPTNSAFLGWHGLQGDRRFAFRRLNDNSGFPWLSASRLPELLLYKPLGLYETATDPAPTHVRTPEGLEFPLNSAELQNDVAEKFGSPVELMKLRHGIFDEAAVSVINLATIAAIGREAGASLDTRRFRENVLINSESAEPFLEDRWIGGRLVFGDVDTGPMVSVQMRDERCVMINFDPDTAKQDARIMKAAVRLNHNNAGVYGTVARTGHISVGQSVSLIIDSQES
jgi:MOSC domain-containing protein